MNCRSCVSPFFSAVLTLCIAGSAAAATQVVGATGGVTVTLGDLRGRIVAIDEGFVSIAFPGSPGSTARIAVSTVSADKRFDFRQANMQADDADAWIELAEHARLHNLHVRRIEALQAAAERDPQRKAMLDKLIAETRSVCGQEDLQKAKELRAAGDLEDAVEHLEGITTDFPDCAAGKQAQKLLDEIRAKLDQERTQAVTQQTQRQRIQQNYPELVDARETLAAGQQLIKQGLRNLDDLVESRDSFEDALARFERVRKHLAHWSDRSHNDKPVTPAAIEEHDRLAKLATHRAVGAHIQLGHVYIARGDQQSALSHLGFAAALDLSSIRVSRLRQAIASSNNW